MKRLMLATIAVLAPLAACSTSNAANENQILVDRSTITLESMMGSTQGSAAEQYLRKARAVVICPQIFKAGFFFGGEGGNCVLTTRASNGSWSDPAFYSMGSGSFGLQIGAQDAQVMIMLMNNTALNAFLNSQFKVGADAGVSVATFGGGVGGATGTAIGADIITFSKASGLYGGVSLSGSVFSNDTKRDEEYYGKPSDARQIVVQMRVTNPGANPLRATLSKYGG